MLSRHVLSILVLLFVWTEEGAGVWTEFDLVRPWKDAWGSDGIIPFIKIDSSNGPNVSVGANFGYALAVIGDLDNNGVDDIAVGAIGEQAYRDNDTFIGTGGVYILFMDENATVIDHVRIASELNGGPKLETGDQFGYCIGALGDMDGDDVPDIAVGAPGLLLPSLYVLYLHENGTVKNRVLIRGEFLGGGAGANSSSSRLHNTEYQNSFTESSPESYISHERRQLLDSPTSQPSTQPTSLPTLQPTAFAEQLPDYTINGPPIKYGSRFGSAVTALGDLNGDDVTEIAVSAMDISGGFSTVYILYMYANSTVMNYTSVGPGVGGGPDISRSFTGFGASLLRMPDFDGDNISELVVGANTLYDAGSENYRAGKAFFCFLNANGTIKSSVAIGELSLGELKPIPNVRNDQCGSSLATIGDINRDHYKQRHFRQTADPPRPSVPDFITGCPQAETGTLPGRFFLMFLSTQGTLLGFTEIPGDTDKDGQGGGKNTGPRIAPPLTRVDGFGRSLAGYMDLDHNGLKEVIVGAPGDDLNGTRQDAGAIYVMFLRRRRHFWIPFDFVTFLVTILVPTTCCVCSCFWGVIFFFYYFRRKPDEVEVIVKKSGYEMAKERKRYKKAQNQVYADNYTM